MRITCSHCVISTNSEQRRKEVVTYSLLRRNCLEGCAARKRAPIVPVAGPLRLEIFSIDGVFGQCLVVVSDPIASVSQARVWWGRWDGRVLDVLLAVQKQAQDDTKELLDSFGRGLLLYVLLEFERAEMCQRLGHDTVESLAEHDNELREW